MKLKLHVCIVTYVFPVLVFASGGFTAVCESRVGNRVTLENSQIVKSEDSDSAPISFVYRNSEPEKIVMLWNRGSNSSSSRTYEMAAKKLDEDTYFAFDRDAGSTHMYTFYPKKNVMSHSMHRDWNIGTGGPVAVSLMAKCKFNIQS